MAKALYLSTNNKAQKISKVYFGADNTAHKVKKIYTGVENKARLVFTSATLLTKQIKDLTVGDDFIYLTEGDKQVKFYVLGHNYESDLNGSGRTLFARESPVNSGRWVYYTSTFGYLYNSCGWGQDKSDTSNSVYCLIYRYLNNDYLNKFSSDIKKWLGTTRYKAYGDAGTHTRGSVITMGSSVFTVSAAESITNTAPYAVNDGTLLNFEGRKRLERIFTSYGNKIWTRTLGNEPSITSDSDDNERRYYYHGIALSGVSSTDWGVFSYLDNSDIRDNSYGYLPCFTLPATLYVTDEGFVSENNLIEGA